MDKNLMQHIKNSLNRSKLRSINQKFDHQIKVWETDQGLESAPNQLARTGTLQLLLEDDKDGEHSKNQQQ